MIDDNNVMYVTDDSPNAEPRYRARFHFDPNSVSMATGNYTYLLQAHDTSGQIVLFVQFYRSSAGYQVRVRAYDSALANYVNSSYVTISDAWHALEVDWGNDGHLSFWIDGVQQANLTGVDNSSYAVESIRLGAPYVSGSLSGSYSIDAYESRRTNYIGPVASSSPTLADAPSGHFASYRLPRPQQQGGSFSATFVYARPERSRRDGDGKRVKSTINGVTTYFVGAHYEVTGSTITKYYYAGSQRIATPALAPGASVRSTGTLYYLLGDHLGSTSLTVNASGQVMSELRYKAWGEIRYSSGTTPTKYQYTGQFSDGYIMQAWDRYTRAKQAYSIY